MNISKLITPVLAIPVLLASCGESDKDAAGRMLSRARSEYRAGRYDAALAAIDSLRRKYPTAIEERREGLALWQDATEKKAQRQVAALDIEIQAASQSLDSLGKTVAAAGQSTPGQKLELNRLRQKRDSLQAEFDAQCALVRLVREKRKS